ncbi:hypothetical protein BDP27DRAFT_1268649 [Rhodocollybia butyracea]|uniref:DUF6533 domain-containing protein n=1 Tax=Rhodocollybia butyracea TaxID=206335 RepID=A0A9P5U562_9AGAR|nr:hypothetical protein BDP27DRAFT_1268649 [Rhodocollybia butyracea]
MSDSSSDQAIAEEIINLQFDWLLNNYTALSAFVLWFYDFSLTLPTEVRSIWSSRLTGSSMIFILSRYSFLLYAVMQLVIFLPGTTMTDISCRDVDFTALLLACLAGATTKLLSILRVYALFNQNRLLIILFCPFIVADIVIAFLSWFSVTTTTSLGTYVQAFSPCFGAGGNLDALLSPVSPLLQLTFDSIIFILTLTRTARHIIQSRKLGSHTIVEVVLRDGTSYFFIIFIVASIQASITLGSLLSGGALSNAVAQVTTIVSPFLAVLPNLLINRFVLNLRAYSCTVQYSGKGPSETSVSTLSAPNFAENRFIGNMGAPLDPDQWDEMDELSISQDEQVDSARDGGWEILDRADPLTTLVPVIYDYEKGSSVSFMPMRKERYSSRLSSQRGR